MAINFGSKGRKKAPRTFGGQPTHTEQPHTEQPQRNEEPSTNRQPQRHKEPQGQREPRETQRPVRTHRQPPPQGDDIFRTLGVRISQLPWYAEAAQQWKIIEQQGKPNVTSNASLPAGSLLPSVILGGLWLTTLIFGVAVAAGLGAAEMILWVITAVTVTLGGLIWWRRSYQGRGGFWLMAGYVGYVLANLIVAPGVGATLLTPALFIAWVEVSRRIGGPTTRQPRLNTNEIVSTFQWGTAGGNLTRGGGPFSATNTEKGRKGEILTAQLISTFQEIPGVRAVHSIDFPGFKDADIDHVLLCGKHLVLVDAKNWAGGHYQWIGDEVHVRFPNGSTATWHRPLVYALEKMRKAFPTLKVSAVVVAHSNDGRPLTMENAKGGLFGSTLPQLMTPEHFLTDIGNQLVRHGLEPVRAPALTKLVGMAK